eukprot:GHUV01011478.1.p1 GENE.GHUV01011478.1~~GHUV01011478.1.p1  ORF type:complete len:252 (+),score=66.34 GHUV01011478.1:1310-2065(+)
MDSQTKVVVIAGYGTGISAAVARRFGRDGYKVALISRTQARLDQAVADLSKAGITAKGYACDLADAALVKRTVAAIQQDLGPINILHYNAYVAVPARLMDITPQQLQDQYNVQVTGLIVAVQAAHPDLMATRGAVLVTGGAFALETDTSAQMAVDWGAAGFASAKAAQRKMVHVLHKGLAADGIYAAEVTVRGVVRGTQVDPEGKAGLTPESIAEQFWVLSQQRDADVWFVEIGSLPTYTTAAPGGAGGTE